MGQRSRKRRGGPETPPQGGPTTPRSAGPTTPGSPADATRRGYARSRERDDALRAGLEPLAPGERPRPVTIAALLAGGISVANLVLYLAGWDVQGRDPNLGGALALCAVLAAAAIGMWRMRYWAVLGFEVLLGVLMVTAALSLLVASNLRGALLAVAVIAATAPLFWTLIRTMARLQMPERPRRETPDQPAR